MGQKEIDTEGRGAPKSEDSTPARKKNTSNATRRPIVSNSCCRIFGAVASSDDVLSLHSTLAGFDPSTIRLIRHPLQAQRSAQEATGPSHWGFVARGLGLRLGPGLGFGLVCGCGGGARPYVLSALLVGPSGHHPLPFLASFATRTRAHQWALKALPGVFLQPAQPAPGPLSRRFLASFVACARAHQWALKACLRSDFVSCLASKPSPTWPLPDTC